MGLLRPSQFFQSSACITDFVTDDFCFLLTHTSLSATHLVPRPQTCCTAGLRGFLRTCYALAARRPFRSDRYNQRSPPGVFRVVTAANTTDAVQALGSRTRSRRAARSECVLPHALSQVAQYRCNVRRGLSNSVSPFCVHRRDRDVLRA